MTVISPTKARNNFFKIIDEVSKYDGEFLIVNNSKGGDTGDNVVIISESSLRAMKETLHITSVKGLKEKIIKGLKTPISRCKKESEIKW